MAYTHKLLIEIIGVSNKQIKADCEFNEDNIATFQITDYGTGGLSLEQAELLSRFVDLGRRIFNIEKTF